MIYGKKLTAQFKRVPGNASTFKEQKFSITKHYGDDQKTIKYERSRIWKVNGNVSGTGKK